MKGEIRADHMPANKFQFRVAGLADLGAVTVSGIEDELEAVELPDRTMASGGQRKAGEFEIGIPMHHTAEIAAMELWFVESQDPVLPTYKKPCTLLHPSISGQSSRNFTLTGVFPKKRALPDLDKSDEGNMNVETWTMSYDNIIPI